MRLYYDVKKNYSHWLKHTSERKFLVQVKGHLDNAVCFNLGSAGSLLSLHDDGELPFEGVNKIEPCIVYPHIWLEIKLEGVEPHFAVLVGSRAHEWGMEMRIHAFREFGNRTPMGNSMVYPGYVTVELFYDGSESKMTSALPPGMNHDAQVKEEVTHGLMAATAVYNTFMKLMQCKNIVVHDVIPSKSQQRRRKRKLPLISYKTLVINPGKQKSSNGNNKEHLGGQNRVHLCRGHFKTYTEENPLFGQYTGRYWWQPHVRAAGNGIVVKDYKLK